MHRATSVGSTKSAYRSRVYESDPWEVEDARVGKLGQPDVATGPAIPPYIMGRAWQVGAARASLAAQNRRRPRLSGAATSSASDCARSAVRRLPVGARPPPVVHRLQPAAPARGPAADGTPAPDGPAAPTLPVATRAPASCLARNSGIR